jgi:hypothetical protein
MQLLKCNFLQPAENLLYHVYDASFEYYKACTETNASNIARKMFMKLFKNSDTTYITFSMTDPPLSPLLIATRTDSN